jgi:hypothetical protein
LRRNDAVLLHASEVLGYVQMLMGCGIAAEILFVRQAKRLQRKARTTVSILYKR